MAKKKYYTTKKNVVTTFTKGNAVSNCGEYNVQDLLDMFDETVLTNVPEKTVNECIDNDFNNYKVNTSLVITDNEDGMFCYAIDEHCDCGNELLDKDVICESCEDEITDDYIIIPCINHDIIVPCSAELDNQMYNESI